MWRVGGGVSGVGGGKWGWPLSDVVFKNPKLGYEGRRTS